MASIGVMTTEYDEPTFDAVVAAIAAEGLGCVQLQLGSVLRTVPTQDALLQGLDVLGDALDPSVAAAATAVLAAHGVAVAAVDGTYNMAHPDPDRRARNLDRLVALVELATAFGTDIVTLCTGTRGDMMWRWHPDNQTADAWDDLVAQVEVAARSAERAGVTLAFEPEHNNVVDSARQARRLMDEVGSPAVKVLMDGANIFHRGDLARMRDHLTEAFALVGADIVVAHAKDLDHDGDAGGRAAGQGRMDYGYYLQELQRYGFDGAIVLHQLSELAPDRRAEAFRYVRDHAPSGYLEPAGR